MTVRFEQAWKECVQLLRSHREGALSAVEKVVLVRDILGRIHLAFWRIPDQAKLEPLLRQLAEVSGPFWAGDALNGQTMYAPDEVFGSPDAFEIDSRLWAIERSVVGADWGRAPLANREPRPPRATLYGLKGGVGRSTALCVWARHLAELGKRVLVVDLDLESPGVSSLLLSPSASADYGLVDWFVEDAVGNADAELVRLMVAGSPVAAGTSGEVLVAPCAGTVGGDYLAKLSRAYVDLPGPQGRSFGERLAELIDQLEEEHKPDVVLLDSRAGLHDLAAIATTRLDAMTFMFAAGTRQTWAGYRILLESWAKHPDVARDVRGRVRVVASQIPETERGVYLERLRQESYDVFSETLYEESGPESLDAFNFDVESSDAPHDPLKIYWSRPLQDWDPVSGDVTPEQLDAAYSDFLQRATELLLPVTELSEEGDHG